MEDIIRFIRQMIFFRNNERVGMSIGMAGALLFTSGLLLLCIIMICFDRSLALAIIIALSSIMALGVFLMIIGINIIDNPIIIDHKSRNNQLYVFCQNWQKYIMKN